MQDGQICLLRDLRARPLIPSFYTLSRHFNFNSSASLHGPTVDALCHRIKFKTQCYTGSALTRKTQSRLRCSMRTFYHKAFLVTADSCIPLCVIGSAIRSATRGCGLAHPDAIEDPQTREIAT